MSGVRRVPQRIAWRKRQGREAKDPWLADLIVQCQQHCKQTYRIRRVRRWIQRQTGKTVNTNAILCIIRKLSLLSVIRRRKPYTRTLPAGHSQVSESAQSLFRSGKAKSVLGDRYHLYSHSRKHAVHVRRTRLVRKGRPGMEDRLGYVSVAGHGYDPRCS